MVMTETARRLLVEVGPARREDPRRAARRAGGARAAAAELATARRPRYVAPCPGGYAASTRFLLSTFGLLSAGKGIETMIDALPAIIERHPEVLYLIAGRTHPQIARREGEEYRLGLERAVVELGLERPRRVRRPLPGGRRAGRPARGDRRLRDAVPEPGADRIRRADVRDRRRVRRRLDAVPVRRGHAPSGAGQDRPFGDPGSARRCGVHSRAARCARAARAEARRVGAELAWPAVAEATAAVLGEAAGVRSAPPTPSARARGCEGPHRPPANARRRRRDHPARERRDPEPLHGYCVDDVARLAVVALELARRGDEQGGRRSLYRVARVPVRRDRADGAGMRNFMAYDRRWLDEPHVGDHVGRSVWALGEVLVDRLGAGRRRPDRPDARLPGRLPRPRGRRCAPRRTRRSGSRGSIRTGSTPAPARCSSGVVDQLAGRIRATVRCGLALVRGSPDATTTPACRTR